MTRPKAKPAQARSDDRYPVNDNGAYRWSDTGEPLTDAELAKLPQPADDDAEDGDQ